jgi:PPE-repeat protein
MLWHAMPPELNTARLMAGAGPAPMLQAAAGWEALGTALEAQAVELAATLVSLKGLWTGASSERAIAAITPMVAWLHNAAQHAHDRGMRATAQAASYTKALAMTPSLPEIAVNHVTHAVLTATNFLGINLMPIGLNEVDYFVRMWNQAGGVMDIYQAETLANTAFEPLTPMKPILRPGVGETVTTAVGGFAETAAEAAPRALRQFSATSGLTEDIPIDIPAPIVVVPIEEQIGQFLGQLGPLNGLMQQLIMPLQQISSLAGQTGSMGNPSDTAVGDRLGGDGIGQVGLLGASPLSNHPLAGGSGPKAGLGLMHAGTLPGAGGTSSRTGLMSQLIDKSAQTVAPAAVGAGAGASAMGGAAPMGLMGQHAQSGAGSRPGLGAPAVLAEEHDEDQHDGLDDQDDDW